jgi:hypothetical protein
MRLERHSARANANILAACLIAIILVVNGSGCSTRASSAVLTADSTWVYPSKRPNDVNARIGFTLKDSKIREEHRRIEREQKRELARQERAKARELARQQKEAEKQAALEKKRAEKKLNAEKTGKKGKKGSTEATLSPSGDAPTATEVEKTPKKHKKHKKSKTDEEPKSAPEAKESGMNLAPQDRPSSNRAPHPASWDLLASSDPEAAGAGPASNDTASDTPPSLRTASDESAAPADSTSVAAAAPGKQVRKQRPLEPEEHVFDMEEGAKVSAAITLENPYGRGGRPLPLHLVWINPAQKAAFRKMVEYVPNDSSNVLISNFGISPSKRVPGHYSLRVYLFRELIAEKFFELRGVSTMPQEDEDGGGDN